MSSNLDRSLDEILASKPRANRRGTKTETSPPGGVRKRSSRPAAQKANATIALNAARAANKAPPTGPSGKVSATKIIVSNLPYDVTEEMIKEYFHNVVGPVRRAILTYGPDGRSRGVATVEFAKAEHASTAAQKFNGVEVDKRPMKVELVIDPNAPLSFADRVGAPNKIASTTTAAKQNKPKPATPKSSATPRGGRSTARGNARGGRASGSGRGKPKTAEQLDQEMSDYFGHNDATTAAAAPAATTAAANGADVGMDDTVL